ncbi:MAG: hypothetical protein ACKO6N_28985 [Myxococcota bacterium]
MTLNCSILLSLTLVAVLGCSCGPATSVDVGAGDGGTDAADGGTDAADGGTDAADAGQTFVPDEIMLGDPATGYYSVEISPDMRFMVWQEVIGGTAGPVWSCGLDPVDATLIPPDGRGFRLDNIPSRAAPQFGIDQTGVFFVTVDATGRFLIVRPTGPTTATVQTLSTSPDTSRAYPYPTRIPGRAGALVAFIANDTSSRPQIHLVDTANPGVVHALTSGPIDMNGTSPSFVVTVFRWFPGVPELTWGFNDSAGRLQIRTADLTSFGAAPVAVTAEPHDHVDSFPAILRGERVLVGGIDSTTVGAFYTLNSASNSASGMYTITRRIEPTSALASPMMASSFEPFEFGGRRYASYQVLDGGRTPGQVPSEIWTVDLDTGRTWRISDGRTLNRMDPEYFLGRDEVFVIHYARVPASEGFRLYRARTGIRR